MQSAALSPLQAVKSFLQSGDEKSDGSSEEVRQLRRRIADLEAKQKEPARKISQSGRKQPGNRHRAKI
jgi:hypothetical protein